MFSQVLLTQHLSGQYSHLWAARHGDNTAPVTLFQCVEKLMIVLFICVFRNRDMEAVLGVWYRCQCGSYSEGGLVYALILVNDKDAWIGRENV